MREQLLELAYAGEYSSKPEASKFTFEFLSEEIKNSKHGNRFGVRDFDLDNIDNLRRSGLDVGFPLTVAIDTGHEDQIKLGNAFGNLLMPGNNWESLVQAFQDIYSDEVIAKHKRLGGSILFLSNHLTYADQPEEAVASTLALGNLGVENPQFYNTLITHRLTSLFRHDIIKTYYDLLELENSGDKILENILLPFANDIHTLPRSKSGYFNFIEKVVEGKKTRAEITNAVQHVFYQTLNLGNMNYFIAGSGQEAQPSESDTSVLVEARVGRGTCDMISGVNNKDYAERLLTIPLFIYANPFTGEVENPIQPAPTPFVFLEPRFLKSSSDVHATMEDIVSVGNVYKPSGAPNIKYDSPRPDWAKKDSEPKILIAHAV